jgi:predicted nucleic-acid-binding protein
MIALDTNVLVRFLVKDDPAQSARAERLIVRTLANGDAVFVSPIVLCECVWVLSTSYGFARREIVDALELLFRARGVQIAADKQVHLALQAYARGKGDFADYLIREEARAAGVESVTTFDRALLREKGFVAP